jgi:hypothetical protein
VQQIERILIEAITTFADNFLYSFTTINRKVSQP